MTSKRSYWTEISRLIREAIVPLGKPRNTWIYSIFKGLVENLDMISYTPRRNLSDDIDVITNGTTERIKYTHLNSLGRLTQYCISLRDLSITSNATIQIRLRKQSGFGQRVSWLLQSARHAAAED
ncbi:MAG: hypothetical protein IPG02_15850 [Ignavibacteria bacterium]|nr:hypothetical protein [Ignavibacteria bacterium]